MAKKDLNLIPVVPDRVPTVKRAQWEAALGRGENDKVIKAILEFLHFFEANSFKSYCGADLCRIDEFVAAVFSVITNPRFNIKDLPGRQLIASGHLFSNLVATSCYQTTDGPLLHTLRQDNNLAKVMFLANSRCNLQLTPKAFFDVNPAIASIWFTTYTIGTSNPTELMQRNLLAHLEQMDERWIPPNPKVSCMYFTTTYLAPEQDRRVKGIINQACKTKVRIQVKNNPDPRSIAIVSAKWHRNHAVYKSAGPLVNQLHKKFDLTLVHLGDHVPENLVTENFVKVVNAKFKGFDLALPPEVQDNRFAAVYFPDIGMNDESLWLSNTRLAPIQAMGYGHPATSGDNSEIDYFIGGDCEKDMGHCYGEQMILIPGLAQSAVWPSYDCKHNWQPNDKVIINCVWGPDKYNYTMLRVLSEISDRTKTEHEWHFFPSPGINRYAGLVPFTKDVHRLLPNSVIHSDKEYYEYMEQAEKGDFAVNSFPFGGFNTIVEPLYLGLPIVTLEGDRYYNRAASYLLRQIGLESMTTTNIPKFMDIVRRLIDDEDYRTAMRKKLAAIDLKAALFEETDDYFLQAFEYIFKHHPIKTDTPILIGA